MNNKPLIALYLGLALIRPALADTLVDDFNDNDAVATWDGTGLGSQWGDPLRTLPGVSGRLRTRENGLQFSDGIGGVAGGYLTITDNVRLGNGDVGGDGLLNSDRSVAAQKFEASFAALVRDSGGAAPTFNATGLNYIRFTAWIDAPTGVSYIQAGTAFYVALTSPGTLSQLPFASIGPWSDPDGGGPDPLQLTGVPIGTAPTAFVVSFSDMLKDDVLSNYMDVVYAPGIYDAAAKQAINGLEFGFRRAGDYPADAVNSSLFVHPDFHLDDVMLLKHLPFVLASPLSTVLEEAVPGDTVVINVLLTARPSGNVTVTALSSDTTEGTVGGPLQFTPNDYNTPQGLTVTVADDGDDDGNAAFNVSFTATGDDLYYNGLPPSSVGIVTADDDGAVEPAPTPYPNDTGEAVCDYNGTGCTDLDDFLLLLDYWQTELNGHVIDIDDFLCLLDNWQSGPNC